MAEVECRPIAWWCRRAREYGLGFLPKDFSPDGPTEMTPGENTGFKVAPDRMTYPRSSWTKSYRFVKSAGSANREGRGQAASL